MTLRSISPAICEDARRVACPPEAGFVEAFERRHPRPVLETLLSDRTTGRNIIWADGEYERLGDGYRGDDEITVERITGARSGVIRPRVAKEQERQSQRTKTRAEVFTPSWLVNRMNNFLDRDWFRHDGAFSSETPCGWDASPEEVRFPKKNGRGWHAYVESRRLEITCGEAPFVCSRYDTVTGAEIPVPDRIGFLDRKLRVVSERTKTPGDWVKWALAALRATYGFEIQGDSLLIARINVLETFCEHFRHRWGSEPGGEAVAQAAWIVSWNLWQMNGFTGAVPTTREGAAAQSTLSDYEEPRPEPTQLSLFDALGADDLGDARPSKEPGGEETVPLCVIYDWHEDEPFEYVSLKGKAFPMEKKFYAVIGNPPYQEEAEGNQRKSPIYNYFMDEAYRTAEKVELITPARFLFDAGQTPKEWNRKMLDDPHFEVLEYESDASQVFSGVEIKGGVAITLRDAEADFGPIGTFVAYEPMKGVLAKVKASGPRCLSETVTGAVPYKFSDAAKSEHPEYVELMGKSCDLRTNILDKLYGKLFFKDPIDDVECAAICGLFEKRRECLWIQRSYIEVPENFYGYKVLLSKASGAGAYGEKLSSLAVAAKGVGHTQSFVSMGNFSTEGEADALTKYLKTKFARSLLGILKVTQDITPRVWSLVPLQDFTPSSDIDWSKSVADIDRQLYRKYGLDEGEVEFVETHVREME